VISAALALAVALFVPLLGAVLIALAGRWPNLRETVTLVTAVTLFALVLRCCRGLTPRKSAGDHAHRDAAGPEPGAAQRAAVILFARSPAACGS
jgi:hypothetical protein